MKEIIGIALIVIILTSISLTFLKSAPYEICKNQSNSFFWSEKSPIGWVNRNYYENDTHAFFKIQLSDGFGDKANNSFMEVYDKRTGISSQYYLTKETCIKDSHETYAAAFDPFEVNACLDAQKSSVILPPDTFSMPKNCSMRDQSPAILISMNDVQGPFVPSIQTLPFNATLNNTQLIYKDIIWDLSCGCIVQIGPREITLLNDTESNTVHPSVYLKEDKNETSIIFRYGMNTTSPYRVTKEYTLINNTIQIRSQLYNPSPFAINLTLVSRTATTQIMLSKDNRHKSYRSPVALTNRSDGITFAGKPHILMTLQTPYDVIIANETKISFPRTTIDPLKSYTIQANLSRFK